jgi:hypothetical protein
MLTQALLRVNRKWHFSCAYASEPDAAAGPIHPLRMRRAGVIARQIAQRGVRNVSLVNIERIGKGLKTSLSKLFGGCILREKFSYTPRRSLDRKTGMRVRAG